MQHERRRGHDRVERRRDPNRSLHADEGEQRRGAEHAGGACSKRVRMIKEPDGTTCVLEPWRQVSGEHRKSGAHQQGRKEDDQKGDYGRRRKRKPERRPAEPLKDVEGCEPERGREQLDDRKHRQQGQIHPL